MGVPLAEPLPIHTAPARMEAHKKAFLQFNMLYSTRLHFLALSLSDRWEDERVNTTALACSQIKTFKSHYLNSLAPSHHVVLLQLNSSYPLASRGDGHLSHKARYKLMCLKASYQGLPAFSAPAPSWLQSFYRHTANSKRDSDTVLACTAASHPLCSLTAKEKERYGHSELHKSVQCSAGKRNRNT